MLAISSGARAELLKRRARRTLPYLALLQAGLRDSIHIGIPQSLEGNVEQRASGPLWAFSQSTRSEQVRTRAIPLAAASR